MSREHEQQLLQPAKLHFTLRACSPHTLLPAATFQQQLKSPLRCAEEPVTTPGDAPVS